MRKNEEICSAEPAASPAMGAPAGLRREFVIAILALTACFALPLYHVERFAFQSDLYSYIILVPLVSAYLFWSERKDPPAGEPSNPIVGAVLLALGLAALAWYWLTPATVTAPISKLQHQDTLAIITLSYVFLVGSVCAFFLGRSAFRRAGFPLAFLLFMVPFPIAMEQVVEGFLQRGSAPPAYWLFKLADTPVFKNDMVFQLPGITLQVAPECSGIRSTLVLFMTSLIAGHLFLRSPWKRTLLAVIVIPLALARNAVRIFTIGELCVHVGPHMIDSDIHHKGGPIFFVLSLIPFFLLVFYLVKSDRAASRAKSQSIAA